MVDLVNYHLQQPVKQADTQKYHINLLKKWVKHHPVVSAFATLGTDHSKCNLVQWGEDLTHTQGQELMELVVFSFLNHSRDDTAGLPQD